MNTTMTTEDVPLDSLQSHPRQFEFFSPASDVELKELAADLERRGQQEPIHVCPDGTIIRGHRRVAAARLLAWNTIRAIIRHDLADPTSNSTVADLITDNVIRQQLDDLAMARCYHALKLVYVPLWNANETGDIRDVLAARLQTGKSGRSMDRLERLVVSLPRDIQDMISRKLINKHQGEKILRLSKSKQQALFDDLRREERVPDVLRRYGVIAPLGKKSTPQLGEELLRFLRTNLQTLNREIKALDRLQIHGGDVVTLLDRANKFLSTWAERKRLLKQEAVNSMKARVSTRQIPDKLSNEAR